MGCQTDAIGHTQFFASDTYKVDIYHGISHLIRAIFAAGASAWSQCSPLRPSDSDRDAGGSGAAGQWAPPQTAFTGGI